MAEAVPIIKALYNQLFIRSWQQLSHRTRGPISLSRVSIRRSRIRFAQYPDRAGLFQPQRRQSLLRPQSHTSSLIADARGRDSRPPPELNDISVLRGEHRTVHDSVTILGGHHTARRGSMGSLLRRTALVLALVSAGSLCVSTARAQSVDCNRLQAQIAQANAADPNSDRLAAAAQKQRSELGRTVAYAHSIGCDRSSFVFFGPQPPAQCPGINAQIQQMHGNFAQLQGQLRGGAAQTLVAQYNAYCGGAQVAR